MVMKMHGVRWSRVAGLALGISGCNAIAGINAGTPRGEGGGSSQTSGGGGAMVCTPSTEVRHCYGGFTETEGKGTCKGGEQKCSEDGSGFGDCVGEVMPTMADDCANDLDTTCDGKLSCPCTPKETQICYDGMPATTAGVGICKSGMRTCNDDGKGFGECVGEVKPAVEDCTTQADENCDGAVNEMASGCVCDPAVGPSDCTGGQLGACAIGTHVCAADGKSYSECTPKLMPSFEDCFTPEDEDCDGKSAACMGTSSLSGAIGTTTGDENVFGSAIDATGNIFLGGVSGSNGGANYAVTSGAAEIIKLDKNGALVWQKFYPTVGGGSYAVVRGVTVDGAGNVIVIGEYQGTINANGVSLTSTQSNSTDVFVIKLATDGTLKWSKSYGNNGDQFGSGISASPNGDLFLTGTMSATMSFGASTLLNANNGYDVFVARLDGATGDPKWGKSFGSNDPQYGWDIAAMPDGNIVVTGQAQGEGINFGSGYIGTGIGTEKDIFLTKLDGNNGNQVWAKAFGDDNTDQIGYSIATDSKSNIVITGSANGSTDFGGGPLTSNGSTSGDLFVASFASDGTHRWSKLFGDISMQVGRDVAVDAAGNVLVTGYFTGSLKFDNTVTLENSGSGGILDVFVAKFKGSDGSFGWARSFGDAQNDQVGRTIATDPSANAIFAGAFKGTIDFGPPTTALMSTNNSYDAFWAKLAP
jgi:hypothetical protein